MAGLLSPEDASLMALGTGLLGGGTFAQAFGRGGQAALSTYAAMAQAQQEKALKERELAMQEELRKAQIANYLSEAKAREQQQALAQQKQAQIQGLLSEFNTPQAPINAASAALAGGGGPTMANAANLPQPNPADRMSMIQRMAVAGVPGVSTLFDVEKWKADPLKMEPGATYENRTTKQRETIPRLPEGGRMDGGQFSFLPGYENAIASLEGSKAGATERAKAGMDLTTITPAGSTNPVMTTRGALVSSMAPSNITTNMVGDPASVRAQIMAQVPPGQREAVLAAYERQLGGGMGIGIQSEAEKAKATAQAKADVERGEDQKTKGNQFSDFKAQMTEARKLLAAGPTGSGMGAAVDSVGGFFGYSPSGSMEAKALEALAGHMMQNIPKAPGAQSDAELRDYKVAAGQVGDRTIPVKQRAAALDTIDRIVKIWEQRVNGGESAPQAKTVKRTGTYNGKRVIEYSDGSVEYAN